ncbi:ribulose-phosphate 3-epimerase [Alloiococcus sp. CFN-8]|uniref:ribulose-phosphate 3-epimerase n=1 Tax=Alloiococcus sp. CFN-8 TaxID=3416081 RepID=UPI003CF64ADA
MVKIAPSILSADFAELGKAIDKLEKGKADMIHIDVMDGSYVPNISFGIPIIKSIRGLTKLPFDVHLMIDNPSRFVKDFAEAGADMITIHWEADVHIDRTINLIKSLGVKCGIVLNPATPVEVLKYILPELDMVLLMSVNPGFGGQKYISYTTEKIRDLKNMIKSRGLNTLIEVDGGIDSSNIKEIALAGVDIIVAGSAVFKDNSIEENIKLLKECI